MSNDLRQRLKQSVAERSAMINKYGFIPMSILNKIGRGKLSNSIFNFAHETPKHRTSANGKQSQQLLKEAGYKDYKKFPRNTGCGRGKSGLSIMPAELVEFFVNYYAKPGDVYLDPFMGQGVQMQVAKLLGLHYYGYDLSEYFFKYIDSIRAKIDDGKTTIQIINGDSKYPKDIPDNIGDFSFHSPPYWDIEFYGKEPDQLGYGKTYQDFLKGMYEVAKNWLPKFKTGAFHVVNVNDFRKDNRYYPYHSDIIQIFQKAGWLIYDMWIIEGLVGGLPKAFAVSFNQKKIAPKIHEYAIVFRKP
ncbi:MAG: hypothetical protein KA807_17925 [Prolixibacteraceae bacterium]|nr:hypothetical protein [Prolixibacteraceae bacterium]